MSILIYLLKFIGIGYACILIAMFLLQRTMLYHPSKDIDIPPIYNVKMEEVDLVAEDGIKITGWYGKAASDNEKTAGKTIVYFHGNAGHLGERADKYDAFMKSGLNVFALSYRGFGASEGSPTEEGLYKDGRAAIKYVMESGVALKNIILYGESLGTGVAVQMATEFDVGAIVLEAPYTSISNRGAELYPFIPVKFLMRDKFDSLSKISGIKKPILIFHGELDNVIPVHHGRELFKAANDPKEIIIYPQGGHSDRNPEEFAKAVVKFLFPTI